MAFIHCLKLQNSVFSLTEEILNEYIVTGGRLGFIKC